MSASEMRDYFGRPARPRVRLGDEPGASIAAYDDQFRVEIADQVFASVGDNATAHFDDMHITLWPEERMYIIGANGNDGLAYQPSDTAPSGEQATHSKYHREIVPGVWVDVYSVLVAFNVTNPADAHAIKKMLMPGKRGAKNEIQDRVEAIQSLRRAIEIEEDLAK